MVRFSEKLIAPCSNGGRSPQSISNKSKIRNHVKRSVLTTTLNHKYCNLHLQVGARLLQMPVFKHSLVPLPTNACPLGHEYVIAAPVVKFLPATVVFCNESGDPHDNGST